MGWDGMATSGPHKCNLPNATLVVAGPGASSSDKLGPGSGTASVKNNGFSLVACAHPGTRMPGGRGGASFCNATGRPVATPGVILQVQRVGVLLQLPVLRGRPFASASNLCATVPLAIDGYGRHQAVLTSQLYWHSGTCTVGASLPRERTKSTGNLNMTRALLSLTWPAYMYLEHAN